MEKLCNARIKVVQSFHELVTTPFSAGINALCWARTLPGNYREVVEQLALQDGINQLDAASLQALSLSAEGRVAVEILCADLQLLEAHGLAPVLDCIHGYPRDTEAEGIPTDVFSFHADRAPVAADTYLCTYYGATSEAVRNESVRRRVDNPETRAKLLKLYGGADDESFREFLREKCYDLHYEIIGNLTNAAAPEAEIFSFGLGNLWRIAIEYPGCPVPPCIHRAPETPPGQPPRLLLIS